MELSSSVMNAAAETDPSKNTVPAPAQHDTTPPTDELNAVSAFSIPPRESKNPPLIMGAAIKTVFQKIGKLFIQSGDMYRGTSTAGVDDSTRKDSFTLTNSVKQSVIESVDMHATDPSADGEPDDCLPVDPSLFEATRQSGVGLNSIFDDPIWKEDTRKNDSHIGESDIWRSLYNAVPVVALGDFSNLKAKSRRDTIQGGKFSSVHNHELVHEIECLIHTLNDIKKASTLAPRSCVDVIAREIASISTKLDLTTIEVKNNWTRIDELSSSLMAMELMSGRKQIEELKAGLSKLKDENRFAVNYNNTRRARALFSSYGYNQLLSLLDKQTSCIISFIKESPAYDIEYSAINVKYIRALEDRFPTVRDLALASYCELISTHGVGEVTITKIKNRFKELNLPTVFIDDSTMSKRDVYEKTMNEHMNNANGFKVPYAICGKRGSVYKPVHYNQYINYYLSEQFDEDGNPVVNR